MPITSAGILLYRARGAKPEIFLVHPGGPYWTKKDIGAWSIPKGIVNAGEEFLACAKREFHEETGFAAEGPSRDLGVFRLTGGKRLHVWAVEGDCDPAKLTSNCFEMEWPPRSQRIQSFPEVDRGSWFGEADALRKITKGQRPVIEAFFAGR
jgi:predicted NUDIX family NTP pyrophosphohydrolase